MRWLTFLLLGACVTSTADDAASNGGKADGTADPACSQHYIEWVLGTYKPALEAQPLDDARVATLTELAKSAPCRGELVEPTAWITWYDVADAEVFGPYIKQHGAALVTLVRSTDYQGYLRDTTPPASAALAMQALAAARPAAALERVDIESWLAPYHAVAEEVLTPLTLETTNIGELEGPWTVNAGEGAMLDLVAKTAPKQTRDGGYAAWIDAYGDVLAHGINIDSSDDYVAADPTFGCWNGESAPCSRDRFLDRFAALAPPAHGDDDSAAWMVQLSLWGSLAASSTYDNDARQVARVDAARPTRLSGLDAYKRWLDTVADTASSAVYAASVVPAKPCVTGGDDVYSAFVSAHASLPADVLDAAKPAACN
jgi:hypothetical protein